jgi:hypothetical protein
LPLFTLIFYDLPFFTLQFIYSTPYFQLPSLDLLRIILNPVDQIVLSYITKPTPREKRSPDAPAVELYCRWP